MSDDLDPRWESKLRTAAKNATRWTDVRDRIIAAAVAAGEPLRKVGAVAGLTHAGARAIAKREAAARQTETDQKAGQ